MDPIAVFGPMDDHSILVHLAGKLESVAQTLDSQSRKIESNTTRIEKLEMWRSWMIGVGTALAVVLGYAHYYTAQIVNILKAK